MTHRLTHKPTRIPTHKRAHKPAGRLTERPADRPARQLTRLRMPQLSGDAGMTTAEYAVGIMAACTFALVLLGVVKSDAVRSALAGIVQSALGIAG